MHAEQLKNEAYRQYQAGNTQAAVRLCEQILRFQPNHSEAIYLLGAAAMESGALEQAREQFQKAAALAPGNHVFVNALGEVCLTLGRRDEAVTSFRRAISFCSTYERAHNNLGRALHAYGDLDGAAASFKEAVRLNPRYAIAHNNLGAIFQAKQEHAAAIPHFQNALNIQPNYPEARFNLGLCRLAVGDPLGAIEHFRDAIRLRPTYARAHLQLGQALFQFRRDEEALAHFQSAARLMPTDAEAHRRLADLQMLKGDWATAQETLDRAIANRPDDPDLFARLVYLRQMICDWRYYAADMERLWVDAQKRIAAGEAAGIVPFQALTLPWPPSRLLAIARNHSENIDLGQRRHGYAPRLHRMRAANTRLRIGYLSGDYYDHPIAHLVQGLFGRHDRAVCEVFNYSFSPPDNSPYRMRIMRDSEHFIDVNALSNPVLAERISADNVDILVDLMGHTGVNRLGVLALRPAPIHVSFLGMLGSMGAEYIDYLIGDRVVTPPADAQWFTEKFVTLPHSYLIAEPEAAPPEGIVERGPYGLPEDGFVFCSFNNTYKIEPKTFDVWMKILSDVPGSVLWVYATSQLVQTNLRREAESRGVTAERLVFASFVPRPEHFRRQRAADLFLDTLVYNAAATSSLALQAGLPVLTCRGDSFASRVGASLLNSMGLPELIATDIDHYRQRAVELANRPDELHQLRDKLIERRATSPLFDASRFVRNLERAYRAMWDRFAAGSAPESIDVSEP